MLLYLNSDICTIALLKPHIGVNDRVILYLHNSQFRLNAPVFKLPNLTSVPLLNKAG